MIGFYTYITYTRGSEKKAGLAAAVSMTPEEKSARGRKGGVASAASMTPEERSARGRKAGLASAAKRKNT